jgi:hypothetical protein
VRKSFIVTTQDLDCPDLSAGDLMTDHLTDLNKADNAKLEELGLDPHSVDRLIESRPYCSKLELISRMVLDHEVYIAKKDKVAVSNAREPFRVA